jgi:nucleoside-diphosphate-sugar epimerase
MKIALIGASGNVGSRILAELVARGHRVTAIARHPDKFAPQDHVTPVKGDSPIRTSSVGSSVAMTPSSAPSDFWTATRRNSSRRCSRRALRAISWSAAPAASK